MGDTTSGCGLARLHFYRKQPGLCHMGTHLTGKFSTRIEAEGYEKHENNNLATSACSLLCLGFMGVHACTAHVAPFVFAWWDLRQLEKGPGAAFEHAYRCLFYRCSGLPASSLHACSNLRCGG